jgi:hypothetical protein
MTRKFQRHDWRREEEMRRRPEGQRLPGMPSNWEQGSRAAWEGDYGDPMEPMEHPAATRSNWKDWSDLYEGLGGRGWYEGWREAMHQGQGPYVGRGPRNYKRPDDRIEEVVNERLTQHSLIDATDIEVRVLEGEVTLSGVVERRQEKRLAEDIADSVFGVKDVINQIRIRQRMESEEQKPDQRRAG